MSRTVVAALLLLSATAAYGDIFTWKDGRGVAHYTNSIHEIPAKYRPKARVLDIATGKLGGLATAQPAQSPPQGSPAGSSAAPAAPAPSPPAAQSPTGVATPVSPAAPAIRGALPPPSADAVNRINRASRARARRSGANDRSGEE